MTGFYEGTGGPRVPVPHTLDTHEDVNVPGPTDGQFLIYKEDTAEWVAGASGGSATQLSDLTDVTVTDAEAGQILVYSNGIFVNQSPNALVNNPFIVGTGTNGTNSFIILNSGAGSINDVSSMLFQKAGSTAWSIDVEGSAGVGDLLVVSYPLAKNVFQIDATTNDDFSSHARILEGSLSVGNDVTGTVPAVTLKGGGTLNDVTAVNYNHGGVGAFKIESYIGAAWSDQELRLSAVNAGAGQNVDYDMIKITHGSSPAIIFNLAQLPTEDPLVAGQLWLSGTALQVSAG